MSSLEHERREQFHKAFIYVFIFCPYFFPPLVISVTARHGARMKSFHFYIFFMYSFLTKENEEYATEVKLRKIKKKQGENFRRIIF